MVSKSNTPSSPPASRPETLALGGRLIGPGNPCFVIAEAGINHNGDPGIARRLVEVAFEAGADAVKFQTYRTDLLLTARAPKAEYQMLNGDPDESQQDMLRRMELPLSAYDDLLGLCERLGILFLSSPFEEQSADFLEQLGVEALKIPSGEITNHPFLAHVARKAIPLIVSTGMASLAEVDEALATIRASGNPPLALLHCLSNYPADPAGCNLRAMDTLGAAFKVPVGYSDHTEGCAVAWAAVARGASIIEKHITVDRSLPGPDQRASMAPAEFRDFVAGIRTVESSLGNGLKQPRASEQNTALVARKSLTAAFDLAPGTVIQPSMLVLRRPGDGLPAKMLPLVVGRATRGAMAAGTTLSLENLR
jgi:N-acetylneuraminate synthase